MSTYTIQELLDWKARSDDAKEQKKIRRLIRELRAELGDEEVPPIRRGINRLSPSTKFLSRFDPADQSTWPPVDTWTEAMHDSYIDWLAENKPLHQRPYFDVQDIPRVGCGCSQCAPWYPFYQAMVNVDLELLYEKQRLAADVPFVPWTTTYVQALIDRLKSMDAAFHLDERGRLKTVKTTASGVTKVFKVNRK